MPNYNTVNEYNLTSPQSDFTVSFDFQKQSYVSVKVEDDALVDVSSNYSGVFIDATTYQFQDSGGNPEQIPSGYRVTFTRDTDISDDLFTFAAGTVIRPDALGESMKTLRDYTEEKNDQTANATDNAFASATAAATSEANAATSEANAATSAANAAGSASAAATSASNASTSETNAAASASAAATSASNASTSETNAAGSASAAATSETNAGTSATNAATSETNADASATAAAGSAATAAADVATIGTSVTDAANSATAAATSATNAATSETNAATSASAAATSATNAATSATNAATSASNAATSETNAATSETNAATSASSASSSQTAAASSATAAATSASSASSSAALAASNAAAAAGIDLSSLSETINDTAVDVFIYDTSKDSDGGAWRHRTQHTSWYAEASSASRDPNTRSTRAEFPSVAVIVSTGNVLTIYDGDDPSLPMWMVWNGSGHLGAGSYDSIAMLNGILAVGTNGWGVPWCDFIADYGYHQYNAAATSLSNYPISLRNASSSHVSGSEPKIVNSYVNDVAMTVLPDAPTDPATGLPVPTIAVATEGGVSVIKDDGTVVDIVHSDAAGVSHIWLRDDLIIYDASNFVHARVIPNADVSAGVRYVANAGDTWFAPRYLSSVYTGGSFQLQPAPQGFVAGVLQSGQNVAIANFDRLNRAIVSDVYGENNALANFTTSTYNTGWMPGDIKLAALADTTAETLSGSELVTDFSTYASEAEFFVDGFVRSDVTKVTFDATNDTLDITDAENCRIDGHVTFVNGATYEVSITNDGPDFAVFQDNFSDFSRTIGTGTDTFVFTKGSGSNVRLVANSGNSASISNISVRLADPDRSVNGNGLGVYGSITKAPVATGADVVAYSGFSSSNYLEQPYNSDLDFGAYTGTAGTGDFCVMGWGKSSAASNNTYISYGTSGPKWQIQHDNSGLLRGYIGSNIVSYAGINDGAWKHLAMVRSSGTMYLYVNGVQVDSLANASDVTTAGATLRFGIRHGDLNAFTNGSLALWRISATAPTADQIAKIYEDEKVLFQEDAKATLTGSSDAVTALAYDPDTNLLHVGTSGTSGGRSVFQGLRRVEEHTGTDSQSLAAISAVDGLVVEGK